MTLVLARALLSIEKISYSKSSSSQNLKLSNNPPPNVFEKNSIFLGRLTLLKLRISQCKPYFQISTAIVCIKALFLFWFYSWPLRLQDFYCTFTVKGLFFAITGPPEAPLITNITVNGIRCILQWKKSYNGESPIQMYSVSVWILLSANNGSHYKDRLGSWNTNGTNFTLDVEWNHNYTTSVSAWNKHGQSVSSAERQFKTGRFPQGIKNSSR